MKRLVLALFAALLFHLTGGIVMASDTAPVTIKEGPAIQATSSEFQGIVKAIERYINAGRKGDSKVAQAGFAEAATMSWSDNGKLVSVPIQELFKYFDEMPRDTSCELVACNVAGNVATARIESAFADARFPDMFTLVKDGNDWKIVSKVYQVKN